MAVGNTSACLHGKIRYTNHLCSIYLSVISLSYTRHTALVLLKLQTLILLALNVTVYPLPPGTVPSLRASTLQMDRNRWAPLRSARFRFLTSFNPTPAAGTLAIHSSFQPTSFVVCIRHRQAL